MCLNSSVFPLVRLKNGKRKVLFKLDYKITSINEYNDLKNYIDNINFAIKTKDKTTGVFGYQYITNLMKKEGVEALENIIAVPCGKCEECLKANARSWAFRIMKEAEQYKENYFITITYNDDFLPQYGSLDKEAIPKFNKKLKTYLHRKGLNSEFRFYAVGEYGEKFWRPHYHGIYFNLPLVDLKFTHYSENGFPVYESQFLNDIWSVQKVDENGKPLYSENGKPVLISKGFVEIQDVSLGSASYVARYCDKKRKNLTREDLDLLGKMHLEPEFSRMSRRPGIGANYLNKIIDNVNNEVYKINYKDNNFSIPKYYSNKFEDILHEDIFKKFKSYNDVVSDIMTYQNIHQLDGLDYESIKIYNENDKVRHKKKRGF